MGMTTDDKALFRDKCAEVLHAALVDIRSASFGPGHEGRINDLADLLHNVPRFLVGRDEFVLEYLEAGFEEFVKKHGVGHRYLTIWRMTREEFDPAFRPSSWPWPEPAAAGAS